MATTNRHAGSRWMPGWRWMAVVLATLMVVTLGSSPALYAQDATEAPETPDVVIPGTGDDLDETEDVASPETPLEEEPVEETADEADEPAEALEPVTAGSVIEVAATDPGHPAVLAHGLAFLSGAQSVWQVREVEPAPVSEASPAITNAAFVYQVTGTSVIRNDVTGKRALLSPGEVYFKSGGDPYTTFADSTDSLVWVFEVVDPDNVAADAFYESPLIDDYDEGVFDLQIIRYVLDPGETATLPDHTGPALVVSADGDIDIEADAIGLLGTADGQLIEVDATVTNNSSNTAIFMLTAFGSEVGDVTASPGAGTAATSDATTTDDAASDVATTDDATTTETDTSVDETTTGDATGDSADASSGTFETSINITANAELYVVVVADGVTVFDGPIPLNGQSGVIVGSTFDVYTSSGVSTTFTNSCGDSFLMGYEQGEARYTLTANANSCPP